MSTWRIRVIMKQNFFFQCANINSVFEPLKTYVSLNLTLSVIINSTDIWCNQSTVCQIISMARNQDGSIPHRNCNSLSSKKKVTLQDIWIEKVSPVSYLATESITHSTTTWNRPYQNIFYSAVLRPISLRQIGYILRTSLEFLFHLLYCFL